MPQPGALGNVMTSDGTLWQSQPPVGDVKGPAGAADGAVALYDGTTGKLIKRNASNAPATSLHLAGPGGGVFSPANITLVYDNGGASPNAQCVFSPNGVAKAYVDHDGNMAFGGRLIFPGTQSPAPAPERVLDDYRYSAWYPTLRGDGGGAPTYAHNYGQYVKIGRAVIIVGSIWLSNKGAMSGGIVMDGLPYPSQPNSYQAFAIRMSPLVSFGANHFFPLWCITGGGTYGYIMLQSTAEGATQTNITSVYLADNTVIMLAGVYIANT